MKQKISKKILCLLLVVVSMFGIVYSAVPNIAYAAEGTGFDDTNVLDDLMTSTVNGEPFDIKDYPYNQYSEVQVINFVEYCYSARKDMRENYGLYLYVYNPQGLNISGKSKANKVQMAVSYDESGNPTSYEKFSLELCSEVEDSRYKNLFYKFKIVDRKINGTSFIQRVNPDERRYDISGIELLTYGDTNATEYGVAGTYKFTGYAKGCGADANAESTLNSTVENFETLSLDVYHTNFRTNVSSLGKDHYNEVNTVYFSVPERIFNTYGNLQKIHAEWWEYKTKMATITSNQDFYNQLLSYTHTHVGNYSSAVPLELYCDFSSMVFETGVASYRYGWTYNVDLSPDKTSIGTVIGIHSSDRISDIMPYAFYSPVVGIDNVFSFLYSYINVGEVSATKVQDWIYNYRNDCHGYIDCNGREISADLFESYVDSGRTMGYNNVNVDLADTFDLNSYDSNHSWWDKLLDYGFSSPETGGDYSNVSPIYILKAVDLIGANETIANNLLVNKDDVAELQSFYAAETLKGNRVVLFRFANTDYYTAPASRTGYSGGIDNTDTYVAQMTVFFDFDIIDLTFNKNGVYKVIGVVASPIDIINSFDPPPPELEWWKLVLAVLALILFIALFWPIILSILPYILKFVIWLIRLPFKIIGSILGSIKRRRSKKE